MMLQEGEFQVAMALLDNYVIFKQLNFFKQD